jgi:hypothetical protein
MINEKLNEKDIILRNFDILRNEFRTGAKTADGRRVHLASEELHPNRHYRIVDEKARENLRGK